MPTLRAVLTAIRKELIVREEARQNSQKDMREATSLSKRAILLIHQKKFEEAERLVMKARENISRLWKTSLVRPDIIYTGLFNEALQEYSEANIFLNLVEESSFITPKEINVPSSDYVLGLADVIGEYRRLTLDALREGNSKKAEDCLKTMDQVYVELTRMDESYMLVSGLRRKCDVARRIIETTRGDVTQEIRRSVLDEHLKRVERGLKTQRHV
jgi:translin